MNPIDEEPVVYHAYLLRLWRVQYQGQDQWRASLESPHTGEHQSFANLEQCLAYLREQYGSRHGEGETRGGADLVSLNNQSSSEPIHRTDTEAQGHGD